MILIASGEARAYGTVSEVKARFEPCYIHLHYTGTLPQIPKTEWTRVQPNYAELRFEKDLDPQLILHRLLEARVQIQRFEINQPSLNEVFLTLCGD